MQDSGKELPAGFMNEASKLVGRIVPVTGTAFYLVDSLLRPSAKALRNIDDRVDSAYVLEFAQSDPLTPLRHENSDETVVCTDTIMDRNALLQTSFYQLFMAPNGFEHIADVFFRQYGKIVAVLSCLRSDRLPAFSAQELERLKAIQPFIEFTLASLYQSQRIGKRSALKHTYELTEREVDVLEWLLTGASNKEIARELELGLPTVKTHLLRVFTKTQVQSRSELVAKILAER